MHGIVETTGLSTALRFDRDDKRAANKDSTRLDEKGESSAWIAVHMSNLAHRQKRRVTLGGDGGETRNLDVISESQNVPRGNISGRKSIQQIGAELAQNMIHPMRESR